MRMVVVNEECYREDRPLLGDAMWVCRQRRCVSYRSESEHDEGSSDDDDVSEPRLARVEIAVLTVRDLPPLEPLSSLAHTAS